MLLACHANRKSFGMVGDPDKEHQEVAILVRHALRVGRDDSQALAHIAWAVAYVLRDLAIAKEHMDRALKLNRNDSSAWAHSGWINLWWGNPAVAVEHLGRAVRHDPWHLPLRRNAMAHAYLFLDKHEEALGWAESQLRDNPDALPSLSVASASAAFAGMLDLALKYGAHLQAIDPKFRVSRLEDYLGPYRLAEFPEKYKTGLRMAGLPE